MQRSLAVLLVLFALSVALVAYLVRPSQQPGRSGGDDDATPEVLGPSRSLDLDPTTEAEPDSDLPGQPAGEATSPGLQELLRTACESAISDDELRQSLADLLRGEPDLIAFWRGVMQLRWPEACSASGRARFLRGLLTAAGPDAAGAFWDAASSAELRVLPAPTCASATDGKYVRSILVALESEPRGLPNLAILLDLLLTTGVESAVRSGEVLRPLLSESATPVWIQYVCLLIMSRFLPCDLAPVLSDTTSMAGVPGCIRDTLRAYVAAWCSDDPAPGFEIAQRSDGALQLEALASFLMFASSVGAWDAMDATISSAGIDIGRARFLQNHLRVMMPAFSCRKDTVLQGLADYDPSWHPLTQWLLILATEALPHDQRSGHDDVFLGAYYAADQSFETSEDARELGWGSMRIDALARLGDNVSSVRDILNLFGPLSRESDPSYAIQAAHAIAGSLNRVAAGVSIALEEDSMLELGRLVDWVGQAEGIDPAERRFVLADLALSIGGALGDAGAATGICRYWESFAATAEEAVTRRQAALQQSDPRWTMLQHLCTTGNR